MELAIDIGSAAARMAARTAAVRKAAAMWAVVEQACHIAMCRTVRTGLAVFHIGSAVRTELVGRTGVAVEHSQKEGMTPVPAVAAAIVHRQAAKTQVKKNREAESKADPCRRKPGTVG